MVSRVWVERKAFGVYEFERNWGDLGVAFEL